MNSPAPRLVAPVGWKVDDSAQLYQVDAGGSGYFGVNEAGHVVVRPDQRAGREIDLFEVVEGLKARDLTAPVVISFSDIIAHRLRSLNDAFSQAMTENEYRGRYSAVFPIKVNQQRLVVEEVYRAGKEFGFGLEVGSKPELLVVMAMTEDAPDRLIVCNGFKDDSYIETVILAAKIGRRIVPVVENFNELGLILKHAAKYGVRPAIGVRVKLAAEGAGRWRESAGEKSKFGLFITEILEVVQALRQHDMLDCLKLVHCHTGSQLQDIRRVKEAVTELAHVYAELKLMGAGLEYIDIGGGLGVDYDGSRTNFESSMNYTLNEYAGDVVYRIASTRRSSASPAGRSPRTTRCWCSTCSARAPSTSSASRTGSRRTCATATRSRSRSATCSTPTARSASGAWWSAGTTRCRRASRCCRCSTSAT